MTQGCQQKITLTNVALSVLLWTLGWLLKCGLYNGMFVVLSPLWKGHRMVTGSTYAMEKLYWCACAAASRFSGFCSR